LDKVFKPAFLGRLVIIPYFPIRDEALKKIIVLKLAKDPAPGSRKATASRLLRRRPGRRSGPPCTEVESGARTWIYLDQYDVA